MLEHSLVSVGFSLDISIQLELFVVVALSVSWHVLVRTSDPEPQVTWQVQPDHVFHSV